MRHLIQPLRHLAAVIVVVLDSPPDSIAGLSFQNVSKVGAHLARWGNPSASTTISWTPPGFGGEPIRSGV